MRKLRVLDLFSGIGGFSLGLERAGGFETVAFCEIEGYPRRVLARHWPNVPCYDDVRTLTAARLAADGIAVDVICGGFPCQDVSFAGKRAGLEGARSGLWREYARLIGELRPRFVIVENVPGLLNLGMGEVLGDLAALGYDATWDCIPASAVGAPHRRDRVWVIAHVHSDGGDIYGEHCARQISKFGDCCSAHDVANSDSYDKHRRRCDVQVGRQRRTGQAALHDNAGGTERRAQSGLGGMADGLPNWVYEPVGLPRVAKGVQNRKERLKGLGNAVVPQVVELIGRAILNAHMHNLPDRKASVRVPQQEGAYEAAEQV